MPGRGEYAPAAVGDLERVDHVRPVAGEVLERGEPPFSRTSLRERSPRRRRRRPSAPSAADGFQCVGELALVEVLLGERGPADLRRPLAVFEEQRGGIGIARQARARSRRSSARRTSRPACPPRRARRRARRARATASRPKRSCASSMPATTPGTATAVAPCTLRSSFTSGQAKRSCALPAVGERIVRGIERRAASACRSRPCARAPRPRARSACSRRPRARSSRARPRRSRRRSRPRRRPRRRPPRAPPRRPRARSSVLRRHHAAARGHDLLANDLRIGKIIDQAAWAFA